MNIERMEIKTMEVTHVVIVHEVSGYDRKGNRRTFGRATTKEKARADCEEAARQYIWTRPDLGPFEDWSFE